MSKSLDDLLADIRLMLQDRRLPYRYSDTDLLNRINNAFRDARRLRPDVFLGCCSDSGSGTIEVPTYTTADLGVTPTPTQFPIDEMFFTAIQYHVVGTIQLGDDEFSVDNRAMSLLAAFRQNMLGV